MKQELEGRGSQPNEGVPDVADADRDEFRVSRRTRRLSLAVSLLTLALYVLSARALPMTFDEQIVYDTTAALAHGRPNLAPNSTSARILKPFPGLAVKRSDGKQVGIYGLGTSIVGVPLYGVGKVVAEVAPEATRERWAEGRAKGFDVTYWQTDEHGRWQRMG